MNVFDVLREKFEKCKDSHFRLADETMEIVELQFVGCYTHAIEIVNQVEQEYNNGWIPCSERLPQENEPVDAVCEVVNIMLKSGTVTSGWCNRYLERWYVLDEHCDYPLHQNYEDVIAWQPLPQKYEPKGE